MADMNPHWFTGAALRKKTFDDAVEIWLRDQPKLAQKIARGLKAYYFNKIPRRLRPIGAMAWAWRTAVASSAPAVAYFFYQTISGAIAVTACAAIFAGHSIVSFLERLSNGDKNYAPQADTETIIRFGEILSAVSPGKSSSKDDTIRSALSVIEIFTRQVTSCRTGEISVSLALYVGESKHKMVIKHRNIGNTRPTNRKFECDHLLGHRACQAGRQPRIVHDLRSFGKTALISPTQSSVAYRSILLLPIARTRSGPEDVCGFLSIDCVKPYGFYGNRARKIIVDCQPVVAHIQQLI